MVRVKNVVNKWPGARSTRLANTSRSLRMNASIITPGNRAYHNELEEETVRVINLCQTTRPVTCKAPFRRMVNEIASELNLSYRFDPTARLLIQLASEEYLEQYFRDGNVFAVGEKRSTLKVEDVQHGSVIREILIREENKIKADDTGDVTSTTA